MNETKHLLSLTRRRIEQQRNYEPKLRMLVETRSEQLGFSANDGKRALQSIDAFTWKLTCAGIHLERLWENRESKALNAALEAVAAGKAEPHRYTNDEVAYLNVEIESYVVQARALISTAQVHTLDACRVGFGGHLTNETYARALKTAPDSVRERLCRAQGFFSTEVFGREKWGHKLKSLRDRVLHFDRLRPTSSSTDEGENLTITGVTLETLAQEFENGTYDLLVHVIAPIWGREWKAGPPVRLMWE